MRTSKTSWYREAEKLALLRRVPTKSQTGGSQSTDELAVHFIDSQVVTRLVTGETKIWDGAWNWQATADGIALEPTSAWEEVCWHSDADVDYLEIEQVLTNGWRLQRQMLLARKDAFLLLADALLSPPPDQRARSRSPEPYEIHHAAQFSLVLGISNVADKESRELFLTKGKKKLVLALPLALPEWRSEYAPGNLSADATSLNLKTAGQGRNLYAPLWLDLDPGRIRKPFTWRRLTVAEALVTKPRDVAVGYRVQVGPQQWLVYRSVAEKGNRTVLGKNFATEFVCCQFLADGQTKDILEIQ